MTTTQISCIQGTTRSAVSISCAAGEELSIVLSLFNANGTARDCSGGTVSFSFERPSRTGTPLKSSVSGQSNGVHTVTLLSATTRLLDGQYTWDAWYHPASGAPEKLVYNGTWTVTPSVGSGGDESVDSLIQTELDDIQSGAIRVYGACAAVRADTTAWSDNPTVYVIGRGVFRWTASAGTDTTGEDTSYIANGAGGFALEASAFRDYTDVTTAPPYKSGRVFYNENSLNLMTDFSGVTIQLGEETQVQVYNGEATQIDNAQAVYAYGPQGQRLDVRKLASGAGNSSRMIGLMTHNVSSHNNGRATTYGLVRDVATNAYSAGAELYTSSVAGVLSATQPTGDQDGARIGIVMNSHPTDGAIFVCPQRVPRLASATGNLPSTPRLGEVYFNTTLGYPVWWNGSVWRPAFVAGYTDIIGTVDQATASAALTYEEYRDTPAIYSFLRHDQNDACTLKYQTPHNWTLTAVEPHVHVIPCGNATGVLVLDGYIAWSRLGTQALPALSSWTPFRIETTIQGASQWTSQAISLGSFTPPANAAYPSAILHVYLRRPGQSDAVDTYTASKPDHTAAANILLEFADCHVQVLGFGTAGLYS